MKHQLGTVMKKPEDAKIDDLDLLVRFSWLIPHDSAAEYSAVKEEVLNKEATKSGTAVKRASTLLSKGSSSSDNAAVDEMAMKRAAKMFAGRAS